MSNNRLFKHSLICVLIVVVGLSMALVLPWLASSVGIAAQSEIDKKDNAPAVTRYYVAKTGDGTNPALGWSTAFTNVQDALALAAVFGGEIWVAAGVYYPDQGNGQIDDAKDSTFGLAENVKLYGGFDTNDSTFSERDWEKNVTVLSGDVDGDDTTDNNGVVVYTGNINGVNAAHVVSARNVSGTAVLDGFTITAGYAHNSNSVGERSGGGLYCNAFGSGSNCNPTLTNVTFSGNSARSGGAMWNEGSGGDSSPKLTNVTFVGNSANYGGGMRNSGYSNGKSSPNLKNVVFSGNSAKQRGGAMYNDGSFYGESSPSLTNVTFSDNSAVLEGGAMYNDGYSNGNSSPSLINVTFYGNSADSDGGGMYNDGEQGESSPILINVTFSGNNANFRGGSMYSNGSESGDSSPRLTNVTFSGNFAGELGGGMYNNGYDGNSTPLVQNSILWNNKDNSGTDPLFGNIYNNEATVMVRHTIIQGANASSSWTGGSYVDGGGNIDEDPRFITPLDPSTAPTLVGDLRLQIGSPAIDVGDNTDILGFTTDLDGRHRIVDGDLDGTPTVDMGAYEFQIEEVFIPLMFK